MRRLLIGLIAVAMFSLWVAASPTGFDSRLTARIPADGSVTVTKFAETVGDSVPWLRSLAISRIDPPAIYQGNAMNRGALTIVAGRRSGCNPVYGLDIRADTRRDSAMSRMINVVMENLRGQSTFTGMRMAIDAASPDTFGTAVGIDINTSATVDSATLINLTSNFSGAGVTNIMSQVAGAPAFNAYLEGGRFWFDGAEFTITSSTYNSFFGATRFDSTLALMNSAVRGRATLPSTEDSVWIYTGAAGSPLTTMYFLTPYKTTAAYTGWDGSLYIRKATADSFCVAATGTRTEDVKFFWMIIKQ